MKITFFLLHLSYGGIERAVTTQANLLCSSYEIELVCFYRLGEPAFELDPRVSVSYLSDGLRSNREELHAALRARRIGEACRQGLYSLKVLRLRKKLVCRAMRKCGADICVSTRQLFNSWLARCHPQGAITIAQEHNHHNNNEKYIRRFVASLRGIDYLMPVSRELAEFYTKRLRDEHKRTECLYVSHSLDSVPERVSELKPDMLISVGRLSPEKGFCDLIDVFALAAERLPGVSLSLIGDGTEREAIEQKIAALGLGSRVTLFGFRDRSFVLEKSLQSFAFVMTSFTESFGLVLIEAQAAGLPCVAFDSARGAAESISDGVNGRLIPGRDKARMADELVRLATDEPYRKALGAAAREGAMRFSPEAVRESWKELIQTITERRNPERHE